ncbi:ABC-type multidrug transport system, ATPase component [Hahella chejuensis KCTC 2396]|uniref:ABC-type multidrug transport system, ATPase component n=1 Tax=Hahella chejuensis (strain KCTC 2396) TaxID=349521 RepID=Q2SC58_HAHCH|nr:ABC transporter ATP-binding protein [Hahella chejuensis]ABC31766.1 ABC-type multidrug transport system, ATPase component [Hahella chejuensis KCTC 2396]
MIKIQNLEKKYGDIQAVSGISFDIAPGEVLGFLGPNGAGKTTTMRMITGYVQPSGGSVSVMGVDVAHAPQQAQRIMGYLPEGAPLYGEMTVAAFLSFIGKVRGLRGAQLQQRIERVVAQVSLQHVMQQPIETLSKGFKRRVGLAQALIHDPQVLILDEPTDGLDPNQKHEVRKLIQNLSKDKIVVISTHILEEVDALCSRVVIISKGRIVANSTPAELATQSRFHKAIFVRFSQPYAALAALEALPEVGEVEQVDDATYLLYASSGAAPLHAVNQLIHSHNWDVEELHVERGRLDDVFRRLTMEAA